jgi:NAD(P)-dependent dehydrogenase (short-subunit alcohol dehydrogenase family)
MSNENVVLVTGGTGSQGGATVTHLLPAKKVRVRVLTRNVERRRYNQDLQDRNRAQALGGADSRLCGQEDDAEGVRGHVPLDSRKGLRSGHCPGAARISAAANICRLAEEILRRTLTSARQSCSPQSHATQGPYLISEFRTLLANCDASFPGARWAPHPASSAPPAVRTGPVRRDALLRGAAAGAPR